MNQSGSRDHPVDIGGASHADRQSEREAGLALALAEFGYLSQTAFQVNEDRARVSQFFLATFGTLIAAIYSKQPDGEKLLLSADEINWIFSLLFVMGMLMYRHWLTMAQRERDARG